MQEPPLQESCLAAEVALLERIMLLDEEAMREVKAFIGDQEWLPCLRNMRPI